MRMTKYKDELNLIISLKDKQKLVLKEALKKEGQRIAESLEKAKEEEERGRQAMKDFELRSLQVSIDQHCMRRGSLGVQLQAQKAKELDDCFRTMQMLEQELAAKKTQKLSDCLKNSQFLQEVKVKKQHERLQERRQDREFAESEAQRIDSIVQKNQQFREEIADRLRKYEPCLKATSEHQQQFDFKRQKVDSVIDRLCKDRLEKELLQDKHQTEQRRTQKSQLNSALLSQIENAHLQKQVKLQQEVQEEHDLMIAEKERLDDKARQRQEQLCQMMREVLDILKGQIEHRHTVCDGVGGRNRRERSSRLKTEGCCHGLYDEGALKEVPGFAPQYDRHLMVAYQNNATEAQKQHLEELLKSTPNDKENAFGHLGTKQRGPSKGASNLPVPQKFSNEYELIRLKGKQGFFNIITNSSK